MWTPGNQTGRHKLPEFLIAGLEARLWARSLG
jgi:hypothetical protein